jgi:glycosyltransferase involved in cell wall biosynthesis
MKVAYMGIKGLPSKAGADRVVEAVVQKLARKAQLTVYCDRRCTPAQTHIPGVRLICLPTLPGKHLRALSLFVLSTWHALLNGNYDLIHIHNAEACMLVPLLRLRYKVLATSHGQAYARDKWGRMARLLLRLSDYFFIRCPNYITSVSRPLAERYQSRFGRSVKYIPNGVDTEPPIDEEAAKNTLRRHEVQGKYIIFSAGRLDPTKGCHLVLEAFKRVDSDFHLLVVGDLSTVPSYGEELRRMADDRVRFIPFIQSKGELFGLVRRASFLVFPSTVEAMSMVLLETASLEVPIVCSDIPENSSVMGEYAVYFKSGDINDLADKMDWGLRNLANLKNLGIKGRVHVLQQNSWDSISKEYWDLYQRFHDKDNSIRKDNLESQIIRKSI